MRTSFFKIITGFVLLFLIYHVAEYMILEKNSAVGFLAVSLLFFIVAWLVSRWQGRTGFSAWGVCFSKKNGQLFLLGLLAGLIINALMVLTSLAVGMEKISFIPLWRDFLTQTSLLVFGTFISSLTEDILTRGYLFAHLKGRISYVLVIFISSLVYVLNHIHRLDEPLYLLYLFIMGIQLVIPLIMTGNIWYTLAVHWAGNIVYHITNTVMHTEQANSSFSSFWLGIFFVALLVPINYFILRFMGFSLKSLSSAKSRHSSICI